MNQAIICTYCGHDANMHDGDWDCSGCMSEHCNCARSCREVREQKKKTVNSPDAIEKGET